MIRKSALQQIRRALLQSSAAMMLATPATDAALPGPIRPTVFTVGWEMDPIGDLTVGPNPDQASELQPGIRATVTTAAMTGSPALPSGNFVRLIDEPIGNDAAALIFDRGVEVTEGKASVSMDLLFETSDFYFVMFRGGRASQPGSPDARALLDVWFEPDGSVVWSTPNDWGRSPLQFAVGEAIRCEATFDLDRHQAMVSLNGHPVTQAAIPIPATPLGRFGVGFLNSAPEAGVIQLDNVRFASASGCDTTVTTTADAGPGSLRAALACADQTPGRDVVTFRIPGSGTHVIQLSEPLAEVRESVVIDGWSQPGAILNSKLEGPIDAVVAIILDGANIDGDGLVIRGDDSEVTGLQVGSFKEAGIRLRGSRIKIKGCTLGETNAPNRHGLVSLGSGNQLGGPTAGDRCRAGGNRYSGIWMEGNSTRIENCLVGLASDGKTASPNGTTNDNGAGIFVAAGAANEVVNCVVSGNVQSQILVSKASNLLVTNCLVGLDGLGLERVAGPSAYYGIVIQAASKTRILNTTVSGNRSGVTVSEGATDTLLQSNRIGVNLQGQPVPNDRWGVLIEAFAKRTVVGGLPWEGNHIAFNGDAGVLIVGDTSGNQVSANSIHENAGLGIDLTGNTGSDAGDGVDPRDPLDGDDGPNHLLNAPKLSAASLDPSWITLEGMLEGPPNTVLTLEFFANRRAHPSGSGEGEFFVGEARFATDPAGRATYTVTLSAAILGQLAPYAGLYFTASATAVDGSTSELSNAVWAAEARPFDCLRFETEAAGPRTSPWTIHQGVQVTGDDLAIQGNPPAAGVGLALSELTEIFFTAPCPRLLLEVANFAQLDIEAIDQIGSIVARGNAPENSTSQILLDGYLTGLSLRAPAREATLVSMCCLDATPPRPRIASVIRDGGTTTLRLSGLAKGRTVRLERADRLGAGWKPVGTLVAPGETATWSEPGGNLQAYYRIAVL